MGRYTFPVCGQIVLFAVKRLNGGAFSCILSLQKSENKPFYFVYFYSAVAPEIGEDAFEGVIFDTDPPNELTIHCPEGISTTLREELTQSESFTESDFTNGKVVIKGDLTPLTYLLGL